MEIQKVQKKTQAILNALESPEDELSILIVDDERIAELNRTYLKREGPTNVIAFPMREGPHGDINPHILGDVVISLDTCAGEAEASGLSIEERFDQLLVHGILHLFGYDHIRSATEAKVMEAKTQELLTLID